MTGTYIKYALYSTGKLSGMATIETRKVIGGKEYNSITEWAALGSEDNKSSEMTVTIDGNLAEVIKRDANGEMINWRKYEEDGSLIFNDTTEYSNSGERTKLSRYNDENDLMWYILYCYDENGKKAGEEIYNADGALRGSTLAEQLT